MKNLRYNFALKVTAFLLSFVTVAAAVISVGLGLFMMYNNFYSREYKALRTSIMESFAKNELHNAYYRWMYGDAEDYYSDKNVCVSVFDENGNTLYSNYDGENIICEVTGTFSSKFYCTEDGGMYDSYDFYDDNGYYVEGELVVNVKKTAVTVKLEIPEKMEFTDRFLILNKAIEWGYNMRFALIPIAVIGFITSIALLCFLFSSVGHRSGVDGITLNYVDRIPLDICIVIIIFMLYIAFCALGAVYNDFIALIAACAAIVIGYYVILGFLLTAAARIKAGTLIKNTLIFKFCNFLFSLIKRLYGTIKYVIKGFSTAWKAALILAVFLFAEFIAMIMSFYEMDNFIIFWIIRSLWLICAVMLVAIGFYRLKRGSEEIAAGKLDTRIDTKYLFDDLKSFGESINSINEGLQFALDEKMRSERMKTELITNVSHDIKTPLTSVINYVDLIKKEKTENEKVVEYIEVLERQSTRLKKLIEDLVEASKASTGNISIKLTECDAAVLLTQTAGEYTERLSEKKLEPVLNTACDNVKILADGRRLWRVFDNLMNNICKYAQPETRVYLDASLYNDTVRIEFKNISKYPLNISGEELTERFVRGEQSRNTDGNGLGLSIAKSLVELQGGKMEIVIDGDLFKAIITFKAQ